MRTAFPAFVALLLIVAPAQADSPHQHTFQLDYVRGEGAEACPAEATLRRELVKIMRYDPVQPGAPRRVTASVERRGEELIGLATLRDEAGLVLWQTDPIPTTSPCVILVGALALAIDAYLGLPAEPLAPAPAPPPAPPKTITVLVRAPPPAPPRLPPPPPRNVAGVAGVDALGIAGVTPKASLGVGAFAGLRLRDPAISFEIGGRAAWNVAATEQPIVDGRHFPVRSTFLALTAGVCGAPHRFVFLCGHAGAGTLAFSGPARWVASSVRTGFGIVGGRIGVEPEIGRPIKFRAFAELDGLPGSADLHVGPYRIWDRPLLMGAVGVGVFWSG